MNDGGGREDIDIEIERSRGCGSSFHHQLFLSDCVRLPSLEYLICPFPPKGTSMSTTRGSSRPATGPTNQLPERQSHHPITPRRSSSMICPERVSGARCQPSVRPRFQSWGCFSRMVSGLKTHTLPCAPTTRGIYAVYP
jgi:hypothetical protein